MPTRVQCSNCDQSLTVKVSDAVQSFRCPRCGAKVYVGDPDEAARQAELDAEEEAQQERDQRRQRKQGRKRMQARRSGLERVNTGLLFHFISMFLVYAVLIGFFSLILAVPFLPPIVGLIPPVLLLLAGALLVSGLLELVNLVFCLWVPDGLGRLLLLGSMALRLVRFSMFFLRDRPGLLPLVFLLEMIGFEVWMLFLRRIAVIVQQEGFARQVTRSMIEVGAWYLCWVVPAVVAALLGPLHADKVYLTVLFFLFLASLGSFYWAIHTGEDVIKGGFYPLLWFLGVHVIFSYLEVINSLRLVINRRS